MFITKEIQWDMGHRVANHKSKCRNVHGHRYKAEVSLEGNLILKSGVSDEGMVMDFADVKNIAMKYVHDVLDHGFMVWSKDKTIYNFFKKNRDLKHIVVPFVPTSENIAMWVFVQLDKKFKDRYGTGLKLNSVKLWETPTSSALCTRGDIHNGEI